MWFVISEEGEGWTVTSTRCDIYFMCIMKQVINYQLWQKKIV